MGRPARAPHKIKPPQSLGWLCGGGVFKAGRKRSAPGGGLRRDVADVAAVNADIGKVAVRHRGKLVKGLAHGALVGTVRTEIGEDRLDPGHWAKTCRICRGISHVSFFSFFGFAAAYPPQSDWYVRCKIMQCGNALRRRGGTRCAVEKATDLGAKLGSLRRDVSVAQGLRTHDDAGDVIMDVCFVLHVVFHRFSFRSLRVFATRDSHMCLAAQRCKP